MPGLFIFKAAMFSVGAAAMFGLGIPMWAITLGVLIILHLEQYPSIWMDKIAFTHWNRASLSDQLIPSDRMML